MPFSLLVHCSKEEIGARRAFAIRFALCRDVSIAVDCRAERLVRARSSETDRTPIIASFRETTIVHASLGRSQLHRIAEETAMPVELENAVFNAPVK